MGRTTRITDTEWTACPNCGREDVLQVVRENGEQDEPYVYVTAHQIPEVGMLCSASKPWAYMEWEWGGL